MTASLIHVALVAAYPTRAAAVAGITEEHGREPTGAYLGVWRMPKPYHLAPIHLFVEPGEIRRLILDGWQLLAPPSRGDIPAHVCIAPDCHGLATTEFAAAEHGRLAGQDWSPGDKIRLCPAHAADIWSTVGKTRPEDIAPWLRPDAADPPNTWRPEAIQLQSWSRP